MCPLFILFTEHFLFLNENQNKDCVGDLSGGGGGSRGDTAAVIRVICNVHSFCTALNDVVCSHFKSASYQMPFDHCSKRSSIVQIISVNVSLKPVACAAVILLFFLAHPAWMASDISHPILFKFDQFPDNDHPVTFEQIKIIDGIGRISFYFNNGGFHSRHRNSLTHKTCSESTYGEVSGTFLSLHFAYDHFDPFQRTYALNM
ncbi:unnamed protein product [Boreogadus saida]